MFWKKLPKKFQEKEKPIQISDLSQEQQEFIDLLKVFFAIIEKEAYADNSIVVRRYLDQVFQIIFEDIKANTNFYKSEGASYFEKKSQCNTILQEAFPQEWISVFSLIINNYVMLSKTFIEKNNNVLLLDIHSFLIKFLVLFVARKGSSVFISVILDGFSDLFIILCRKDFYIEDFLGWYKELFEDYGNGFPASPLFLKEYEDLLHKYFVRNGEFLIQTGSNQAFSSFCEKYTVSPSFNAEDWIKNKRYYYDFALFGAYSLFIDKPDFVKTLWYAVQPEDASGTWCDKSFVPGSLEELFSVFFKGENLLDTHNLIQGRHAADFYLRKYFTLLFFKILDSPNPFSNFWNNEHTIFIPFSLAELSSIKTQFRYIMDNIDSEIFKTDVFFKEHDIPRSKDFESKGKEKFESLYNQLEKTYQKIEKEQYISEERKQQFFKKIQEYYKKEFSFRWWNGYANFCSEYPFSIPRKAFLEQSDICYVDLEKWLANAMYRFIYGKVKYVLLMNHQSGDKFSSYQFLADYKYLLLLGNDQIRKLLVNKRIEKLSPILKEGMLTLSYKMKAPNNDLFIPIVEIPDWIPAGGAFLVKYQGMFPEEIDEDLLILTLNDTKTIMPTNVGEEVEVELIIKEKVSKDTSIQADIIYFTQIPAN